MSCRGGICIAFIGSTMLLMNTSILPYQNNSFFEQGFPNILTNLAQRDMEEHVHNEFGMESFA